MGISVQGAEGNIWHAEGGGDRRAGKMHNGELHGFFCLLNVAGAIK